MSESADWERRNLVSLGAYINGYAFKPSDWKTTGLPIVRIAQITGSADDCDYFDGTLSEDYRLADNDIVFSWSGTLAVVRWQGGPAWLNQHLFRVTPAERVDRNYLFHVLQHAVQEMDKRAHGSTMKHIKRSELAEYSVTVPTRPAEQSAIARILDTLDAQIEKTQALIAKLEQVKEGLLHDLLTRGVDENGELRPSAEEAPQLYKESELGWIPREWEAIPLKNVIQHVIDFRGRTPRKLGMDWGGGDILALSANNVQPGRIDTSREAYLGSEALYQRWMTNGCTQKGDVLLTMEAPLGNIAQVPDDAKYILSQRVIALRFDPAQLLNDFAFWQMQSDEFQTSMALRSTGTTATGLQRAELVKLPVKAPPIAEQLIAAELLFAMSNRIGKERVNLTKLIKEKNGLMDDLLTGRVRVTPLLDRELAEAT